MISEYCTDFPLSANKNASWSARITKQIYCALCYRQVTNSISDRDEHSGCLHSRHVNQRHSTSTAFILSLWTAVKGAIHSQLNWTVLLCDVIPDGKNWVNCAVLTGNSAYLRTVLSSRLSHTELRISLRESHSFLSLPVFIHHSHTHKKTHRTDKKMTHLTRNLCCAREHSVQIFVQFFYTVKPNSLTLGVWGPYEWILSMAQAKTYYLEISSFLASFSSTGVCCLLLVTALSNYILYAEVIPNKYILRLCSDYNKQRGRLCRLNHKSLLHQKILIPRTKLHPQKTGERKMKGNFSSKLNRKKHSH